MEPKNRVLCVHPDDDMLVALEDLASGELVHWQDETSLISSPVARKHKFARRSFAKGELLKLYGVPVGQALQALRRGEAVTTENLAQAVARQDEKGRDAARVAVEMVNLLESI